MLRVACDVDGVIANFGDAFGFVARCLFGLPPEGYVPSDWNYSDSGLSQEQISAVFASIRNTPDFWFALKPYEDSVAALLTAADVPELYYVTSRDGSPLRQTWDWLDRHGLLRPPATQVLCVDSPDKKALLYQALGIGMSLDDHGPTVEQCSALAGHRAFLLNRPWNREYRAVRRVSSVVEYLELVRQELQRG